MSKASTEINELLKSKNEGKITPRPLGPRIIVRRDTKESTTPGGIVIPEASRADRTTAQVLAVGKGTITISGALVPCECKVGDHVMLHVNSGHPLEVNGETLYVLVESDVMAILE